MNLFPKKYYDKITDVTIEFLNENNIKALILDIDNTLIDIDRNMLPGLKEWVAEMKNNNIKFYLVSNSNRINKVKKVSEELSIPYYVFAIKPMKRGFKKAQRRLNEKSENIAVIGDQIFTDVLGANRCKMFPILVKPIAEKDIWITILKRPLEKKIIEKFKTKEK